MAIIRDNLFIQGASGTIKKQIVYRNYGGQIRMSKYPNMTNRKLSPKQIEANEIMQQAIAMTREILFYDDKRIEAQIRLNIPSNKLYHALKKEFLTQLFQERAERKDDTK